MTATTIALPGHAPAAGGFLRDTLVFARRNVEHIRQIPEKLMDVTLTPVMLTLMFAYVFGGAITIEGGNYREYLVGGILAMTLAFGMMGPAMSIATDLQEGVIDRFRALPSSRTAYLTGHYVAEAGGSALAITILFGTGLLIGWRAHSGPAEILVAAALCLAFATAMIWIGTLLGLTVRTPDAVQGIAFVAVFPLTFVSNALVPIATMPDALQWFASWNPLSALAAAIRELFDNPAAPVAKDAWPMRHPVAASWLYAALLFAVAVPLALRRFRARTTD